MIKQPANPIKSKAKVLDIQDYLKAKNERDYVLFVLGIATGYRAGDLVLLKIRDIKNALKVGYFEILEGKKKNSKNIRQCNMKPRKAFIVSKLERTLKTYIKGKEDYEYAFPSRKGDNIKVPRVTTILREVGEAFGLINITAHSMRKTYAYHLWVENDYNTLLIKELLGHSSIEETKRYLGLNDEVYIESSKPLNSLIL